MNKFLVYLGFLILTHPTELSILDNLFFGIPLKFFSQWLSLIRP